MAVSICDDEPSCRIRRGAIGPHQAVRKGRPEDVLQSSVAQAAVGPAVAGVKEAVMAVRLLTAGKVLLRGFHAALYFW